MQSLGIFGGTFDPVHFGHLKPVRETASALGLEQVRFVPAANPPHRPEPVADTRNRLAMIRLALKDYPEFRIDERELNRTGSSYTINTLESYRAEFGANLPIMMLVGADVFNEFNTWHQWQQIPDLTHIIVMTRPGHPVVNTSFFDNENGNNPSWKTSKNINDLHSQPQGLVFFQDVTPVNISATKIRLLLEKEMTGDTSLLQALPPSVIEHIKLNNLYTKHP
ncbi:MAG: nicotinate-nucleotide adenylyltransferase [Acidiferrobacterales bacterium]